MSCPNEACHFKDLKVDYVDHRHPWRLYDKDDYPCSVSLHYCPMCGERLPDQPWEPIQQAKGN